MTPKEKAIELLDKMNNMPITIEEWNKASDYAKNNLKRKALIVVDEILRSHHNLYGLNNKEVKFYLEVQQEIKKL
jgi:hypothetical protein